MSRRQGTARRPMLAFFSFGLLVVAAVLVWHGNSSLARCARLPFWTCLDCETQAVTEAGRQSPLLVGDRIVAVDGRPVVGPLTAYGLTALFPPAEPHDVVVERAGAIVHVGVVLTPIHTRFLSSVYLAIGVLILTVLALTLVHRPGEPAVLPFVASQGAIAVLVATPDSCTLATNLYFAPLMCLVAPLCFNLLVVLADDQTLRQKLGVLRWAILTWGGVVSVYLIAERIALELQLPGVQRLAHLLDPLDAGVRALIGLVSIGTLVAYFVLPLRWVRTLRARRRLSWLLWGMAAGTCPYVLVYYIPAVLGLIKGRDAHTLMISLTVPFLVLIPLATAVAIVRYRLLDVEVLIGRSITGVATLLLLVPALTFVAFRLGGRLFPPGQIPVLFFLTIPVATAFTYLPVESWVKRTLDSWRKRFDYDLGRAVEELTASLRDATSRDEAIDKAALLIRRLLAPEALLLLTVDAGGEVRSERATDVPGELLRRLEGLSLDAVAETLVSGQSAPDGAGSQGVRFGHVFLLRGPSEPIGVLALRDRAGSEGFSTKDLQLASIVADQLSLVLRAFPGPGVDATADRGAGEAEAGRLAGRMLDLEREKEALQRLVVTDPLTGLCNRRQLSSVLHSEAVRAAGTGESLALLMLDLDHFKRVNDTFGHVFGDRALQLLADAVRSNIRASDTAARFGGEEFVIVLPRADWDGAYQVAEKIRKAVELGGASLDGQPLSLTVSVGAALFEGRVEGAADHVLEEADRALYYAKEHGRNQSVLYADLPARFRRR